MIRLKNILLEHPQVDTSKIDVTKFTNKCNDPASKTALQDAFKQANTYWISRFDSNAWRLKYSLAHPKKTPDEVVNIINKYKQAIENVSLIVVTEGYEPPSGSVTAGAVSRAIAWVHVSPFGGSANDKQIVYARCELSSYTKQKQITIMVHELAHILFGISPFNSFKTMQKAFNYLVNQMPAPRKVNFDEREDLIRQRMKQDPDIKRYMNDGWVESYLQGFLKESKTGPGREYYCSETEKQSNVAALNYELGRKNVWMPITPKVFLSTLTGGGGEYKSSDLSAEAAFLFYCWIAGLGMKYAGGNPDNTNNSPWPTLSDFCKNLSKLVAKQKPPATRNNMPPEGRA